MMQVERICPKCGTSNPTDRARCRKCGQPLTQLPARRGETLPERIERAGIGGLVLSATALIARAGLRLLVNEVLPRVAESLKQSATASRPDQPRTVDGDKTRREPAIDDEPDYMIRGWRTWSIRHGSDQSSGSENFEWKIHRREGGTGKE